MAKNTNAAPVAAADGGRIMTLGQFLNAHAVEKWLADLAAKICANKTMTESEWSKAFDALRGKEIKEA